MPTRAARRGQLVVDTHVWIWAVEGTTAKLRHAALTAIESAARVSALAVSAISVWELAMLVKRRRVTLATSVDAWIAASLRPPGVRIIPVGTAIALDSTQLPDFEHHKDPADRIIIATARRHGTLLTCDEALLDWALTHKHVRVLDGRP
ncbi:MAG: type II toxin-antitoxin system VapC family toxin [Gemmatimonadales bacterium]